MVRLFVTTALAGLIVAAPAAAQEAASATAMPAPNVAAPSAAVTTPAAAVTAAVPGVALAATPVAAAVTAAAVVMAAPTVVTGVGADLGIVFVDVPPAPLQGVSANYRAPARDAAGLYATPNRDLTRDEAIWHMRVALNVAALGCRDADEATTVARYNALLATDRAALVAASDAMVAGYKTKYGAAWQSRHDDAMTRLYNFFAQPPAQSGFCAEAKGVLAEAGNVEPSDFTRFATASLARLEAPFLTFFARHDAYRGALAQYESRHAPQVVLATVAAVSVGPVAVSVVPTAARVGPAAP